MGHHVVRDMVYLRQANQILTAGSLGLRAYTLVSCASATGRRWLLELARIYDCEPFASSLRYHERTDCVVVMWPQAACADVFESQGAAAPFRLQGSAMHARSLTDVMQRAFNVISSCAGGSIKVWYREPAEALPRDARRAVTAPRDAHLRHLHSFAGHSRAVSQLAAHPSNAALFFSAALDGAVRLWDVDALVPVAVVVRLAFGTPIVRLRIFEESTLIVQVDDGRVIGYVCAGVVKRTRKRPAGGPARHDRLCPSQSRQGSGRAARERACARGRRRRGRRRGPTCLARQCGR
ncbi:hypothetical protein M885DRAFT_517628 [Pelagophyceae sp. CCMP2097]|nr:hypothetical protein M885DRAFT_517628 [Pelagophyceae sp. CCMP2097]